MLLMNRIKELRTKNGMTQVELAKIIGVNPVTLSRYESDDRNPKIDKLEKMAEVFNVSVDYLTGKSNFDFTDEMTHLMNMTDEERQKHIEEHDGEKTIIANDPLGTSQENRNSIKIFKEIIKFNYYLGGIGSDTNENKAITNYLEAKKVLNESLDKEFLERFNNRFYR